jgi:hypothetical protein
MFGIENFDKLPTWAQVIVAIIAGITVGFGIKRGLKNAGTAEASHGDVIEQARMAFELADSRLRHDLEQIIAALKQAMIDGLGKLSSDVREQIEDERRKASSGRAEIYARLREGEERLREIELKMATLEGERSRPRRGS